MKHVIVGTAGHIDHGKSALVKALTGIDPDRLEEEKRRGITIDLGFAHLDLGGDLRVGFIDVPGHERFVKNMLAGALTWFCWWWRPMSPSSRRPVNTSTFAGCWEFGRGWSLLPNPIWSRGTS
jgi:hypothetical protein